MYKTMSGEKEIRKKNICPNQRSAQGGEERERERDPVGPY